MSGVLDHAGVKPREKALADVGRKGRLDLVFAPRLGRTELQHAYGEVPLKVSPLYRPPGGGPVQIMLLQPTAGLFGGDRTEVRVGVEAGARVMLISQASLQIHPSDGRTAEQRVELRVESGGEAHYYNDPAIPFAASRWDQRVSIALHPGSRFSFWDGLMAGRIARAERWRFADLCLELVVRVGPRLVYVERFVIEPGRASPERTWAMGAYDYLATALVYDEGLGAGARAALQAALGPGSADVLVAIDAPAPHLIVTRILARTGTAFRDIQQQYLAALFGLRGERAPDFRKV